MKFNTTLSIILVALLLYTTGLIISVAMPQCGISDALMIAALFSVAASGIISSDFTKNRPRANRRII